jgi:hypothetical protein
MQAGCEPHDLLPFIAEVKNMWSYTCIPPYVFIAFQEKFYLHSLIIILYLTCNIW